MECTELQMVAAEAIYNIERGFRPVVFGRPQIKKKAIDAKKISRTALLFVSVASLLIVHFSGVLKKEVTGRVLCPDGVFACDMRFYSSIGTSSFCSTDAAGRFSTRLYSGTYRVVVEKRPGLPKEYRSLSTTPLKIKAGEGLTIKIVD